MEKLLIIDGSNLLFQMFFGMPARIMNKEGKAIQGTLGFTGALIKIIKMTNPSHLIVLFDGEHENARVELLPEYKGNRPDYSQVPPEENPFSQYLDICHALDFLHVKYYETTDHEADDVISCYASKFGKGMEIVISSFDSDFFQLINDHVMVLRYRGDHSILCDAAYIQNRFDIPPAKYADFKSLVGDAADHIKGAEKVGPKTAAALLHQFGSLNDIVANAGEIKRPAVRESILRDADRLRRNHSVIKLDDRSGIPFDIHALIYCDQGLSTRDVLKGIHLK